MFKIGSASFALVGYKTEFATKQDGLTALREIVRGMNATGCRFKKVAGEAKLDGAIAQYDYVDWSPTKPQRIWLEEV